MRSASLSPFPLLPYPSLCSSKNVSLKEETNGPVFIGLHRTRKVPSCVAHIHETSCTSELEGTLEITGLTSPRLAEEEKHPSLFSSRLHFVFLIMTQCYRFALPSKYMLPPFSFCPHPTGKGQVSVFPFYRRGN